jgi:hypothetical protein
VKSINAILIAVLIYTIPTSIASEEEDFGEFSDSSDESHPKERPLNPVNESPPAAKPPNPVNEICAFSDILNFSNKPKVSVV